MFRFEMLPLPSTFAYSSKQSKTSSSRFRNYVRRSRATNLAVSLLATGLLLSLALNFRQWLRRSTHSNYMITDIPKAYLQAFLQPITASHLIIVAGHAVWKGCDPSEWALEDNWVLHEYQKGRNDTLGSHPSTFYTHIVKGAELLGSDPSTPGMLVFSGGITRPTHPFQSEAQSYLNLALSNNLIPSHLLRSHTFTEDYALDSFQNLLFSIMRFHEIALASGGMGGTGIGDGKRRRGDANGNGNVNGNGNTRSKTWPEKITVVGFEMKRARFVELHRVALRWPKERFEYIGVDLADKEKGEQAAEGERINGYLPYSQDLYGCTGELAAKRISRNPFARFHPYYTTNPELAALMDWCPTSPARGSGTVESQIFPGPLPWD